MAVNVDAENADGSMTAHTTIVLAETEEELEIRNDQNASDQSTAY